MKNKVSKPYPNPPKNWWIYRRWICENLCFIAMSVFPQILSSSSLPQIIPSSSLSPLPVLLFSSFFSSSALFLPRPYWSITFFLNPFLLLLGSICSFSFPFLSSFSSHNSPIFSFFLLPSFSFFPSSHFPTFLFLVPSSI